MKPSKIKFFGLIMVVVLVSLVSVFGIGKSVKGAKDMRFGIDIRGGIEAVFEPEDLDRVPTASELEAARNVIETRLDTKNILEREITVDKQKGYIIVRFPWKSDEVNFNPEEAIAELGETAQLTFRDTEGNVLLEGSHVKSSNPAYNNETGEYIVQLSFDEVGSKAFEEATEKMTGKQMAILMDDTVISAPLVKSKISGGECMIDGMKSSQEAKDLSDKINAGALPFSMITSNHSSISPTLGSGALKIMIIAGLVAFAGVCLFMIIYYKLPGTMSCIALCLQMALQLLALSVPQFTLTLPGIAGIILSLGMAVDANVIISERICEEIAKGLSVRQAIKKGYEKAFSSVFDGNFTSAIVAILLMIFGSGSMLSFGYTLLTGLVINFLAGIFVSKSLLSSIILFKKMNDKKWFRKKKERAAIPFYKNKKIAFILSSVLLIAGFISCFVVGVKLDTQFAGGAVLKYSFEGNVDTDAIVTSVQALVNRSVSAQITTDPATKAQKLVLTLAGNEGLSPEKQGAITEALNQTLSDGAEVKPVPDAEGGDVRPVPDAEGGDVKPVPDAEGGDVKPVPDTEAGDAKPVPSTEEDVRPVPNNGYELSEAYVVEPYIGKVALQKSIMAIGLSALFIVGYVWIRFKTLSGLSAGVMAVLALIHDVLFVFFVFVWFGIPINDAYVAVTLTIIGYSINDTIVLYDRIRENKESMGSKHKKALGDLISESITQTLSRSVNTSLTTLMCVLSILIFAILFGIESIKVFALPMLFGLISGCYSSVCIAGPLWGTWQEWKEKRRKSNASKPASA